MTLGEVAGAFMNKLNTLLELLWAILGFAALIAPFLIIPYQMQQVKSNTHTKGGDPGGAPSDFSSCDSHGGDCHFG